MIKKYSLLFCIVLTFCFAVGVNAYAEQNCNLAYDSVTNTFLISGNAPAFSRVVLLVKGPTSNQDSMGICHIDDVITNNDGNFAFSLPVPENSIGVKYDFIVNAYGPGNDWQSKQTYTYTGSAGSTGFAWKEIKINKLENKITATSFIGDQSTETPNVVLALYKADTNNINTLVSVGISSEIINTSGVGKTITTTIDLPAGITNYFVKAMILDSLDNIKPLQSSIYAEMQDH